MALPTLFKRKKADAAPDGAAARAARERTGAATASGLEPPGADATSVARTRARRRLVGAAILLVVGVIAFPVLFETQPRPIPVDIPMVIPGRDAAPALVPPPRPAGRPAAPAEGGGAAADPAKRAGASAPAGNPAIAGAAAGTAARTLASPPVAAAAPPKAEPRPEPKPEPKPAQKPAAAKAEPKPEPKPEPKAEAKPPARPEPKPAAAKAEPPRSRFIVQIGAFADEPAARKARLEVERLGLKTYTQVVDVGGARKVRVRIGPFESQQEANKAAATLKAAKLPATVLGL